MRSLILAFVFFASTSQAKTCRYQVVKDSQKLTWTGYKFTSKLGVDGTFNLIDFTQSPKATSPAALLKSIVFSVDTASIDTGMPYRDKKLALFVFGHIKDPGKIMGKVVDVNWQQKIAVASLKMNDKKRKVKFAIDYKGNQLTLTGKIDLLDFSMKKSFSRIQENCKDLHTGPDGKTKSWSEVGLKVTAKLSEKCS